MEFIEHHIEHDEFSTMWFMEKKGHVFFRLYYYHDRPSSILFDNFSVEEDIRGMGLGTETMNMLPEIAKELGFANISLWCVKDSWLVDWYKKLGYEYLEDYPEENAIWLRKKIKDEAN
jgi:N-acetylglutamate synthase-like GNAT family acetyltransferase